MAQEEYKLNISRSCSRKTNLGNYETFDTFSSRSIELPVDTSWKEQQEISEELFALALSDVERDTDEYLKMKDKDNNFSITKLTAIIDKVAVGKPFPLEDFEKLSPQEHKIIQSVKRSYQRSPMHKDKQVPNERSTANVQKDNK